MMPRSAVYAEAAGYARVMPRAVAGTADVDDVVALVALGARRRAVARPARVRQQHAEWRGRRRRECRSQPHGRDRTPDPTTRRIVVGPGAIRNRVDAAARAVGLRFPVDPSSGAFCSLGGMVSTNAAGARTLPSRLDSTMGARARVRLRGRSARVVRAGEPAPTRVPSRSLPRRRRTVDSRCPSDDRTTVAAEKLVRLRARRRTPTSES
jgi:FAD/FMN-containing dehydrogenase